MEFADYMSSIALIVALITFTVSYWWNRKQYRFSVFLDFVFKESEFASIFVEKRLNGKKCRDEFIQYCNLLETLAIAHKNSTIDRKLSKDYFKKIVLDLNDDFSHQIDSESHPNLRKLILSWS